jgi:hypothetical protein
MERDYLDRAYNSRVDRSQVLVNQWIKIFPESFKDLSICQQRNLAIILHNTVKWLKNLSSKQLEDDGITQADFIKNTIDSYLKLIENNVEVIGLEVPFTTFKVDGEEKDYGIKASRLYQNVDELIISCKSTPENQIPYVSILCFVKTKGVDTIFGSFDCVPFKISY